MSLQPLKFIVNTSLGHPIWETTNAKPGQWQEMRFSQVDIGIDRQWNYKEKWQLITKNQIEALVVQKNQNQISDIMTVFAGLFSFF